MLGVSVPTIRLWADRGRVPSHRTEGGHRRFEVEELADWLRSADAPPPRPRGGTSITTAAVVDGARRAFARFDAAMGSLDAMHVAK